MHFGISNIKHGSYLKIHSMPIFFLYKTGLKMPICAFKDDFKI